MVAAGEPGALMQSQAKSRSSTAKSSDGSRRGRPRKFDRPSRAVTLTLPDDVIAALQANDTDLSRAVVRATRPLSPAAAPKLPAELASYGNRSVILVPRSRALRERTGVELIPIADGRALISMNERLSVPQFELQLTDALADPALDEDSRVLFEGLVAILRRARQDDAVEVRQRHVIILHRRSGGAG
jgi:hypothetical protein